MTEKNDCKSNNTAVLESVWRWELVDDTSKPSPCCSPSFRPPIVVIFIIIYWERYFSARTRANVLSIPLSARSLTSKMTTRWQPALSTWQYDDLCSLVVILHFNSFLLFASPFLFILVPLVLSDSFATMKVYSKSDEEKVLASLLKKEGLTKVLFFVLILSYTYYRINFWFILPKYQNYLPFNTGACWVCI